MTNREHATQLLNGRGLVFSSSYGQDYAEDREGFQRLVDLALEYGATHIHVGLLPFRHDNWVLPSTDDPYAAWCNHSPSLLRICPPEELQEWVSEDEAARLRDFVNWQLEVMRPHGLKGVSYAVEPLWLPEGVYRAHPDWRGPQCELGRIARRPYFAPSIDEPEVLDLYRRAMRRYSTLFPEVDHYRFLSNDSGAGVAWTPNIYPGMNGPVKHRTRDGGQRIAGWLKALQDGAADAGVNMRLNIHSAGWPAELKASAQQQCPSGTFVCGGSARGEVFESGGPCLPAGIWASWYPTLGLGNPESFIAGLQNIYNQPDNPLGNANIGVAEHDLEEGRMLLEAFLANPASGSVARADCVLRYAKAFADAEDAGEELVGVYRQIAAAERAVAQVRQKGFSAAVPFATVSMRWVIRPLVPQPLALTAEEKKTYERFLFSTASSEDNAHFGLVLGKGVFRGESVMWMARWCLQDAYSTIQGARNTVEALVKRLPEGAGKARVKLLGERIGAYGCLVMNLRNCIMYQYALDIAEQPQYGPNPMDYDDNILYDQRAVTLRKIAREELDNTNELIRLIEQSDGEVLVHAQSDEDESVFRLPVDLLGALRQKTDVMLDHWQDYETLYPATKVWDYEPAPRGNVVGPGTDYQAAPGVNPSI